MRVPFRLLFVGWWMAGQRWTVTGRDYPKPSLSVRPEVVTLGGNVTVCCCNATYPHAKFSLYKTASSLPLLLSQTTKDYHAEFILSITSPSDAGIYRCLYYYLEPDSDIKYSYYSDAVRINVTDPSIPKPSIQVKPEHQNALGSDITLECWGQEGGLNFFLRKANTGEISRVTAQATAKANFHFVQVKRQDAGSYVCQYHREGTPFVWSEASDPMKLILKDPDFSRPSIQVKPEGQQHDIGANVTIECKGEDSGLTFVLHDSKNLTVLQPLKAKSKKTKFYLPPLRREDAGNYTCQYYYGENPFVRSELSEPAQIVVTDMPGKKLMTIIWASAAAGLLLVLFFLVLILLLYKKRRKRSAVKGGNQPVNTLLEQNAGTGQDNRADYDGVTYAVLNHHTLKTGQPASQPTGPESCVYASVAKERS